MSNIVLDKCFLQGTKKARILEMASQHRFLMSDALLYELLTTEPRYRKMCFSKLPDGPNPIDLVSHIGALTRVEMAAHKPSGPPSLHKDDIDFQFNKSLQDEDYTPTGAVLQAIEEERNRIAESVQGFLKMVGHIQKFFPTLLLGTSEEQRDALVEAEKALASPGYLNPFIYQFRIPPGELSLPPAESLSNEWAIYRWTQTKVLFALDVYFRYRGNIPDPLTPAVYKRMENDVLDAELFMLGLLEGNFATKELKLKKWWCLLCPEGVLYDQ